MYSAFIFGRDFALSGDDWSSSSRNPSARSVGEIFAPSRNAKILLFLLLLRFNSHVTIILYDVNESTWEKEKECGPPSNPQQNVSFFIIFAFLPIDPPIRLWGEKASQYEDLRYLLPPSKRAGCRREWDVSVRYTISHPMSLGKVCKTRIMMGSSK